MLSLKMNDRVAVAKLYDDDGELVEKIVLTSDLIYFIELVQEGVVDSVAVFRRGHMEVCGEYPPKNLTVDKLAGRDRAFASTSNLTLMYDKDFYFEHELDNIIRGRYII